MKGSKEAMISLKDFVAKQSRIAQEVLSMRGTSGKEEHVKHVGGNSKGIYNTDKDVNNINTNTNNDVKKCYR